MKILLVGDIHFVNKHGHELTRPEINHVELAIEIPNDVDECDIGEEFLGLSERCHGYHTLYGSNVKKRALSKSGCNETVSIEKARIITKKA